MAMDQPHAEGQNDMSFLQHLEELRKRLIKSAIAVVGAGILLFTFSRHVFNEIIFGPIRTDFPSYRFMCRMSERFGLSDAMCIDSINFELINTEMMGLFIADIKVALIGGFVVAFPYLFFQFWMFVKPGLRSQEVRSMRGVNFFTGILFFLGVLFGYFVISPLSVNFLGNYNVGDGQVQQAPTLMSYIKLLTSIALAAGLMFQLPILTLFLTKIGLLTPQMMKKYRKHALVAVLVLSAIITPPDVFSQILIAVPVLLLYEVSIIISRRIYNRQEKRLSEI